MPKLTKCDIAKLDDIRSQQVQVILRSQALDCRMPPSTIDDRIGPDGPWQVLLPGVYLTNLGSVTQEHREMAALLYAGEDSVMTGPCAVRRHRLACPGPNAVDVLVWDTVRKASRDFVRIRRTRRFPESWTTTGMFRFANAPRAVADAVRVMTRLEDVRAVVFDATQKRACTITQLVDEMQKGPTGSRRLFRAVITEASAGLRSAAEKDFQRLLSLGNIPMPMFNAKLYTLDGEFIAMVDGYWEEPGLVGEVDSRTFHTDPAAQDRDRDRHNKLIAHGLPTLHFSPQKIREDGVAVTVAILEALRSNQGRPPLPIVAVGPDGEWSQEAADAVRGRLIAYQVAAREGQERAGIG
jgi:hypothetical protein